MEVHELISELKNYPDDMIVECLHEESSWRWDGEQSFEETMTLDGPVERVEPYTNIHGKRVVRIS
jgi:hypothetical protein